MRDGPPAAAHGAGRLASLGRRDDRLRRRVLHLQLARELTLTLALLRLDLGLGAHLQPRQQRDRVVLDAIEQRAEELERLALVLLLRVLLRVRAQVDALPQVVHRGEVLAPVPVELLQHHGLLEVAHDRRADRLDLRLVRALDGLDDALAQPGLGEFVVLGRATPSGRSRP